MKILLQHIYDKKDQRPEGYVDDVLSHGIIQEDYLEISPEDFYILRDKYASPTPPSEHSPCQQCGKHSEHSHG